MRRGEWTSYLHLFEKGNERERREKERGKRNQTEITSGRVEGEEGEGEGQ